MKPSIELIQALRRAATRIEDPSGGYLWIDSDRCNCGILAQEVLDVDSDELYRLRKTSQHDGVWFDTILLCETTGRPLSRVFELLQSAGIGRQDIQDIETLCNKDVAERAGLHTEWNSVMGRFYTHGHDNAKHVARYFRAQADILEEQLRQQEKQKPAQVSSNAVEPTASNPVDPMHGLSTPRPSNAMAKLAALVPCYHLTLGGACVYCGHVEQAVAPVKENAT